MGVSLLQMLVKGSLLLFFSVFFVFGHGVKHDTDAYDALAWHDAL